MDNHPSRGVNDSYLHAFELVEEQCKGRLLCMRVCPTEAIRVRNAKAVVNKALCIDCGECIVACPEGAFKPQTDSIESIGKFKFKVAIPSPSLFGQFSMDVTPQDIGEGLLRHLDGSRDHQPRNPGLPR